jgi:predicted dehydrogenase
MRYHSIHQKIKELISEGKIGDIVSMRSQFSCWYPDIDNCWRQDKSKSGGGALMDLAVHSIDTLIYLSGLKPVEVTGFAMTQTFNYSADDSGAILMKMDNGSFAYVDANFNIPDEASVAKLEIYGTKGSFVAYGSLSQVEDGYTVDAYFADNTTGYDAMQNRDNAHAVKLTAEQGNMYTKEIEAFCDSIINDTIPPVNGNDAILAQKVIESTYKASETKKHVIL